MYQGTYNSIHVLKEVWPIFFFLDCSKQLDLKAMVQGISIMLLSSEGATRKVSPDWSQETTTCHSSNCFSTVLRSGKRTVGDFSSEQLLIKKIFIQQTLICVNSIKCFHNVNLFRIG